MPLDTSETFSAALQTWQTFYSLAGGASATLLGLLFVAISVNVRAVEQGQHGSLRWVASHTLHNLFYILLLSLFMVAPSKSPHIASIYLASIGFSGVVVGIVSTIRAMQSGTLLRDRQYRRRILMPLVAHAIILFAAYTIAKGDFSALEWLVGAVAVLIIGGIRGSWDLLFLLGMADMNVAATQVDSRNE